MHIRPQSKIVLPVLCLAFCCAAADLPGSKDSDGVKRYAGSEIIGYRAPRFDEVVLPLGPPVPDSPTAYAKSLKVEGMVSRYTYLAPAGRSPAEVFRNYKAEFQRLVTAPLYEKAAEEKGWFGPTFDQVADEDQLGQILAYNEKQERVLVAKSGGAKPTYYLLPVCDCVSGWSDPGASAEFSRKRSRAGRNRGDCAPGDGTEYDAPQRGGHVEVPGGFGESRVVRHSVRYR